MRRGDDAAPGLDEQRIVEDRAQLGQRVADGRLGDAEPRRRAADRALLQHRQEQPQRVAVEVQMIEPLMDSEAIS